MGKVGGDGGGAFFRLKFHWRRNVNGEASMGSFSEIFGNQAYEDSSNFMEGLELHLTLIFDIFCGVEGVHAWFCLEL